MIDGKITDKIYHGCATRYSNGERKLIDFKKGERCICATSYPFWRESTLVMECRQGNQQKIDN